ncbi:hypothetical protein DXB79_05295 [Bacteroides fragilis]|jgi:hypothetical protein|nr:hypothetical protein M127_2467 [Bacteroides fragilis str. S6L5]RGN14755.1 hypothetical protein DXB79_05295 [Bacteroides fragilis]
MDFGIAFNIGKMINKQKKKKRGRTNLLVTILISCGIAYQKYTKAIILRGCPKSKVPPKSRIAPFTIVYFGEKPHITVVKN